MASTELTAKIRGIFDLTNKVYYPGQIRGLTYLLTGGGTLSATATAAGDASDFTITGGIGGVNTSTGNGGTGADITLTAGVGGAAAAGANGRGGYIMIFTGVRGAAAAGTLGASGRVVLRSNGGVHFSGDYGSASVADADLPLVAATAAHANIVRSGFIKMLPTDDRTVTFFTSTDMLTLFPAAAVGDYFYFHVFNDSNAGGWDVILAAGAGGTLAATTATAPGPMAAAANSAHRYLIVITAVAATTASYYVYPAT